MQIPINALVLEFKNVEAKVAFNADKAAPKIQDTNAEGVPAWTVNARHFDETASFNNETDLKITIHSKTAPQQLGRNAPFVCEGLIQSSYTSKAGQLGLSYKAAGYTAFVARRVES